MSAAEDPTTIGPGEDGQFAPEEPHELYKDDPLGIWKKVCTTPLEKTKEVKFGSKRFTSINAYWQIETATGLFGPMGTTWGLRDVVWEQIPPDEKDRPSIAVSGEFYYPGGSIPVAADDIWKAGDDVRKKLITQLITKGLSYLGFGADVFQGATDGKHYVAPGTPAGSPPADPPSSAEPQGKNSPPAGGGPAAGRDQVLLRLTTDLFNRAIGRCKTLNLENVEAVARDLCSTTLEKLEVAKTPEAIEANWDAIVKAIDTWNGPMQKEEASTTTLGSDENAMRALHAWASNDVGAGDKAHELLHDALPDGITSLADLPLNRIGETKAKARALFAGEQN